MGKRTGKKAQRAKITPKLTPIWEVKPYKDNPKHHPEKQVDRIAESIKNFGFDQPIVTDKAGVIIKGHGRWLAAHKLGMERVPVVVREDLTPAQVRASRIADNRSIEGSSWDKEKLGSELKKLEKAATTLESTGFSLLEARKILEKMGEKIEKPEIEFTKELHEYHNYIVLYFENEIDWLQALTLFDLKSVKALHSRKGFEFVGVGRVLDGAEALNKIKGQ